MKQDIILAGVGGQGILSIAYVIDNAALADGLFFKQAEVHGMAQRGGAVQSHMRLSNDAIWSDLIPKGEADMILSVEPLEALRYFDYLRPGGIVVTSSTPYRNIPDYPDIDRVLEAVRKAPRSVVVDSEKLAREAGTVKAQNALYHRLYERLKPFVFEKYADAAANPKNHSVLDGWAKEDARYIVSLATDGQVGLTINARNLELLIRRFAAKGLEELRALNARIHALAKGVAPSIILFTDPSEFDTETYADVAAADKLAAPGGGGKRRRGEAKEVVLAGFAADGDAVVIAALLHTVTRLSYKECLARATKAGPSVRKDIVRRAFKRMEFYDFPPREFEHAELVYDLVVSASCFAQLKRHRMATLTWQRYDPGLGVTVPPSIREIGAEKEFRAVVDRTNEAHAVLEKEIGPAADYVLTNAHKRRALLKVNVRELYHISRLREDATAQWEIRRVAAEMSRLAKKAMPLTCLMLGGKDAYPEIYARVFGRPPKMAPPRIMQ